jgi:outer membrane immunogenic protein
MPQYLKYAPYPTIGYTGWTGFYAGVNASYAWAAAKWDALPGTSVHSDGFMAGGTLGYNYQFSSIVIGVEADLDWSGVDGTCVAGVACSTSNSYLGTVRGRLGYSFDRLMPYLTAGGAYGDIKAAGLSKSNFGWVAGAGVELAIAANWTAKAEYLFVDLGSIDTATAPPASRVSFNESILRLGVNYRFTGPLLSRW